MPILEPLQPPTPLGPYTAPLAKLAEMLAEAAVFQEQCGLTYPDGTANEQLVQGLGGLKKIFYPALDDEQWPEKLPVAVIMLGDDWRLRPVAGGMRNYIHGPNGSLELLLADVDRCPWSLEAGSRKFMNWCGLVLKSGDEDRPGILELAALDDRLAIQEVTQLERPAISPRDEAPYWTAKFQVRYGLD